MARCVTSSAAALSYVGDEESVNRWTSPGRRTALPDLSSDQRPRGINVAFAGEERIVVHAVYLDRYLVRPLVAEFGERQTGFQKQRAARSCSSLGQLLRGHDAQRNTRVHEFGSQRLGRLDALRKNGVEANLLGMGDAFFDGRKGMAVKEIRSVHGVAGGAQSLGERLDSGRQPQNVMEKDDLGQEVQTASPVQATRPTASCWASTPFPAIRPCPTPGPTACRGDRSRTT